MTEQHRDRRGLLQAAAIAATLPTAMTFHPGHAQPSGPAATGSAALKAGIDGILRAAVEARDVPGVVALAATERGIFYEGVFGTRNLAAGPAITLDTVFRIASMTKAVTSVAAMQLVEQGKLSLNDPVPAIDPALARAASPGGIRCRGHTASAAGEAADHAEASADPYGRLQLRAVGCEYARYVAGDRHALDQHGQHRLAAHAAGFRSRRPLGIWRQYRLGRAARRARPAARSSMPISRSISSRRSA